MKTKINIQQIIFKSLAVGISLVLVSFTLNAQVFWKVLLENNSFNDIAIFLVDTGSQVNAQEDSTIDSNDANTFLAYMQTEKKLQPEGGITSEDNLSSNTFTFENKTELPLNLNNKIDNKH